MKIVINNSKEINVIPRHLVVKDGKLFNLMTNEFEGIEGDGVEFETLTGHGEKCTIRGTVKNYTCDRRIELQFATELYAVAPGCSKTIVHRSRITETDCKYEEELAEELKRQSELEFAEMAL
jgi:hypothetical protein